MSLLCVDQRVEKEKVWIFLRWQPTTKLIKREILILKCYQVDVKNINVHFNSEKNMNMFFIVGFSFKQILRIVEYQIEMEMIFSLTRILSSFRKCCLQF